MIGWWKRFGYLALLATGSLGCELLATVDRSKIQETGVARGGQGGTGTGGMGTGGMGTGGTGTGGTETGGSHTGGTGGTGTGGTNTGGSSTGGSNTGGTGTGGTGTGGSAVCADSLIQGAEQCDDGNVVAGDGCDAGCTIEVGWGCVGEPSVCSPTCGDGLLVGNEICDDGNAISGDGCSATCTLEPGFTCLGQPSLCPTICGDGLVTGTEGCDDGNAVSGDGCSATCTAEAGWVCMGAPSVCQTVCGDGVRAGIEACDDANATSFDGCNAACQVDAFVEQEPNGTPAQANGPFDHAVIFRGSIKPASDVDVIAIQLTATSDVSVESFDPSGPSGPSVTGSCANIDTVVSFLGADGTTVIASDDDAGINACSKIDSKKNPAMRHLPAGSYFVKVEAYAQYQPIPGYSVVVSFDAVCGDGQKQGAEECDGSPGCSPTCDRVPVCGDGFIDAPEVCDDGNATSGDGCSATCQYEVIAEAEPNGLVAQANGPYAPNVLLSGAIMPSSDVDWFSIVLPVTADLRLETFDANGPTSCVAIDTVMTLFGTDGTTMLIRRDQGGVNNCSRIDPTLAADRAAAHLPAGTYFVKIESHLGNAVIPGYTLRASFAARCGDGVIEGAEECDGGGGCSATCDRVAVCGDGFVDAPETCDDGNSASGDGCSATCQTEIVAETEPNGTVAQANGPYATHALIAAAINPASDVDIFAIQVDAVSDLRIETFDGSGPGSCVNVDTVATLLAPDGTTVLATQDDGGLAACSRIDPKVDTGARRLAPGVYFVKIADFLAASILPAYQLEITFVAVCGNGVVEGSEECDGGALCDASCSRVPTCGDGIVDAPETCDDGNAASGDGCSATCLVESIAEVEPNGTAIEADAAPLQLTGSATVAGAIGAIGDVDVFRLSLAAPSVVRFETFDASYVDCAIATTIRVRDAAGVETHADGNSGISSCSALVLNLAAGTHYVSVEEQGNDATIPAYLLEVRTEVDGGAENEPNDTRATASSFGGSDEVVLGSHQVNTDTDFFAITVPPGRSIRAEILEGSAAETCESLDIDSFLTLYDASGVAIEIDDDGGRGFCSRIDGTGSAPASPGASMLPGGTYYLAVEAAPFAQSPTDATGRFDYRLVLTVR